MSSCKISHEWLDVIQENSRTNSSSTSSYVSPISLRLCKLYILSDTLIKLSIDWNSVNNAASPKTITSTTQMKGIGISCNVSYAG